MRGRGTDGRRMKVRANGSVWSFAIPSHPFLSPTRFSLALATPTLAALLRTTFGGDTLSQKIGNGFSKVLASLSVNFGVMP